MPVAVVGMTGADASEETGLKASAGFKPQASQSTVAVITLC